jgi:hypothetical protein
MLVRLLGFTTLACGCVVGRYRDLEQAREVAYVESKGGRCDAHKHRQNHVVRLAPREAPVSDDRPACVA